MKKRATARAEGDVATATATRAAAYAQFVAHSKRESDANGGDLTTGVLAKDRAWAIAAAAARETPRRSAQRIAELELRCKGVSVVRETVSFVNPQQRFRVDEYENDTRPYMKKETANVTVYGANCQWAFGSIHTHRDVCEMDRFEWEFLNRGRHAPPGSFRPKYPARGAQWYNWSSAAFEAIVLPAEIETAARTKTELFAMDGLLKVVRAPWNASLRVEIRHPCWLPRVLWTIVYDYAADSDDKTVQYTEYINVDKLELLLRTNALESVGAHPGTATFDAIFAAVRCAFDAYGATRSRFPSDMGQLMLPAHPRGSCFPDLANEEVARIDQLLSAQLTTRLYDYQHDELLWMHKIERAIASEKLNWEILGDDDMKWYGPQSHNPEETGHATPGVAFATDLRFVHGVNHIQLASNSPARRILRVRGGVLADEMGLGKTLTAIALMLTTRGTAPSRAELVYATESSYRTLASLVVCPSHLVQQWVSEINKFCISPLRVLAVTTMADHAALTYQEVIEADVVIVSAQFLQNPRYVALASRRDRLKSLRVKFARMASNGQDPKKKRAPLLDHFQWRRLILDEGHELLGRYALGRNASKTSVMSCLDTLDADVYWYLSGTPFPDCLMVPRGVFRFLRLTVNGTPVFDTQHESMSDREIEREMRRLINGETESKTTSSTPASSLPNSRKEVGSAEDEKEKETRAEAAMSTFHFDLANTTIGSQLLSPLGGHLYDFLTARLLLRSTKSSIQDECRIPDMDEETVWVDMAPIERLIYNRIPAGAMHDLQRRQVCCHLQVASTIMRSIARVESDHPSLPLKSLSTLDEFRDAWLLRSITMFQRNLQAQMRLSVKIAEATDGRRKENTVPLLTHRLVELRLDAVAILNEIYQFQDIPRLSPTTALSQTIPSALLGPCTNDACATMIHLDRAILQSCGHPICTSCRELLLRGEKPTVCCPTTQFHHDEMVDLSLAARHGHLALAVFGSNASVKEPSDRVNQSAFSMAPANQSLATELRGRGAMLPGVTLPSVRPVVPIVGLDGTKPSDRLETLVNDNTGAAFRDAAFRKGKTPARCLTGDSSISPGTTFRTTKTSSAIFDTRSDRKLMYDPVLINQYGSKMAAIIHYIRRVCSADDANRVIVFSQWQSMLNLVGDTLDANGIGIAYCKGNVLVRTKAIRSFNAQNGNHPGSKPETKNQKATRVLLLSLGVAASGTNLTRASHILLVDPVEGSKEEAMAMETQAIGRVHRQGQTKRVKIVRFLCRDSIEEDLYRRNKRCARGDSDKKESTRTDAISTISVPIRGAKGIAGRDVALQREATSRDVAHRDGSISAYSPSRRCEAAVPACSRGYNLRSWQRLLVEARESDQANPLKVHRH